jgi:uncharacterized protein (UPF0333 family)
MSAEIKGKGNEGPKDGARSTGKHKMFTILFALILLAAGAVIGYFANDALNGGGGSSVEVFYQPVIDPSNFTTQIDNIYMPLIPGSTYIYNDTSGGQTSIDTVVVMNETKIVLGVECVVVRDTLTLAGEVTEDTFDWYAQDLSGNVWYFGEDTREYSGGKVVSTAGTWEAGVDGAQPGILMLANPLAGLSYRQEYYKGEAEDVAEVLVLSTNATVPFGQYDNVLRTREWSTLDPSGVEDKYYAPGIGCILEFSINGNDHVELIDYIPS